MKKIHFILIVMVLVGIGLLVSASKDMSTYATFETAIKNGQRVKIAGELAQDEKLVYEPEVNPNLFSFFLVDSDGKKNKVILMQPKPQDFEMSEQVVVTGEMINNDFVADEVLMKCPSKYKDEELALRRNG